MKCSCSVVDGDIAAVVVVVVAVVVVVRTEHQVE